MSDSKETAGFRYDRVTILVHWTVAVLVIEQWIGGRTIDWFPKGPPKIDARSVHILVGAILAGLVLFRLYWRAFVGAQRPTDGTPEARLVKGAHWALMLLLLALVGLGLALASLRADSLFGLARIPAPAGFTPERRHLIANDFTHLHGLVANVLLGLIGLHAGAALVHRFWLRDGVMQRMLWRA